MAAIGYYVGFTQNGTPATGLLPTFLLFKTSDGTSGGSNVGQPTIFEVGQGWYAFSYDPEANGDAVGTLDGGTSLINAVERYQGVVCTRGPERTVLALPSGAPNTAGGSRSPILASGTCQAGSTSTTAVLAAGDTGTVAAYVGALLQITGGTGIGQTRTIAAYNAGTKTVTLATGRTFGVVPDASSTYIVVAEGHPQVNDALQVVASSVVGTTGDQTAIAAIQTVVNDIQTDADNIETLVAAVATPAQVATALANAGVTATVMQQLSAVLGSSSVAGNAITFTSLDGLHVYTLTASPSIAAPTSAVLARVS
jgi:hypothetical protein